MKRRERGSSTLEVLILVPVLVAMLLLIVYIGRISIMNQRLTVAVHDAARAASAELDAPAANDAAQFVLDQALGASVDKCRPTSSWDTSAVGENAETGNTDLGNVVIEVTCSIDYSLLGPIVKTHREWTRKAVEPVDVYRSRKPKTP